MADPITIVSSTIGAVPAFFTAKKELWDPLMRKIASSKDVKEICSSLKEASKMLQSLREDYENEVQEAYPTKVPSNTYNAWNHRVKNIEAEVQKLVDKCEKRKQNLYQQKIREKMKERGQEIYKLWNEGLQIKESILGPPKPEPVKKIKGVPEIRKFETLQKPLEDILDYLQNDRVHNIGIYGPPGLGKTVIMQHLNNHEEVAEKFEIVIWVTVSKVDKNENLSRECLQEAIVKRLQIRTEGNSNADEVEEKILMALKDKRYLLLLDDVKEVIDLPRLGIPYRSNGSKLVLTTRQHYVYFSMVDQMIKVECLGRDEAWEMFKDVLQNPKLLDNFKIKHLAGRLCKECCGLPIFIDKIANAFKQKCSERLWSEGLNSWRKWPKKECQGIMEMYEILKVCYDYLDNDIKKCFLYVALYPEENDISTNCLLECWEAEYFLGNNEGRDAKEERLNKGDSILTRLKHVSLLEQSQIENHVTMHRIIRQMALYVLEDDPECKYLVQTSSALRKPPAVESWCEKNRISLGDNKFSELPDSPNCSMLSTLFLQKNLVLDMIPALFFRHMGQLRVLDLSQTGIKFLPTSLAILTNLKVLYLNNCKQLEELPSDIVKLEHLETLDIRGTKIYNIPRCIEELTCIRRLRVQFTKFGNGNVTHEVNFNYELISKLSNLEELVIDVKSPDHWSNEVVENIIKEVATLEEFKTLKFFFFNAIGDVIEVVDVIEVIPPFLRICVPEATILLSFIRRRSWENIKGIKSFVFFIGCKMSEDPQIPGFHFYEKYVKYCNGAGSSFPIPEVFADVDAFELVRHKDIKQLSDVGIANINEVKGFLVESCDAIETIMGTMDSALLPNLEHLFIKKLPKLESIWKGPTQPQSLTKLTTLVLTSCQRLVKIFTPGLIQQLIEIRHLEIEDCSKIEEIITASDARQNLRVLPKLKKLILLNMSKLRRICTIQSLEWPSLEELNIFECKCLCELPFNKDNAAKLKFIKVKENWWKALKWQNEEVKERFELLKVTH